MAKILLVEDEPAAATFVNAWLTAERYVVELATDGSEAIDLMMTYDFDLILLDWDLPLVSGIDVLTQFRKSGKNTPVIMLTAKSHIIEKEIGLDGGADDYLTKPFELAELSARIRALLRRSSGQADNQLALRDLVLIPEQMRVLQSNEYIDLLPKEFSLLEFFMRNPDRVFTAQAIMERVWKFETEATTDAFRSALKRLRRKIDRPDHKTPLVETVHGSGYRFNSAD
jgi:DNA-binding response OmpR family regulator